MMRIVSGIVDWVTTPYTIYQVIRDPTISRAVKVRAAIGLAVIFIYVVSPIDIIPDYIPLSGWLDDLVIVPLGLAVLRKVTTGFDVVNARARAETGVRRIMFWAVLALVVAVFWALLWLALLVFVIVKLSG
jgi:uncharacterized membrane protein YkvA (DUF1232 family)